MRVDQPSVVQFNESTAVIVGGTSGVGLAAAIRFALAGVPRILLAGRNQARGESALAKLRAQAPGVDALFLSADVNDAAQAQHVAEAAIARFGSVEILLNSTVGSAAPRLLKDTPIEELQDILVQQAIGPINMSRAILPEMTRAGRGVILNVASDAAKLATPGESVIGAAMAAIVMFTRTLAIEAKRNGIRVNALTPSLIQGTLTHQRMQESDFASKLFAKAASMASLGVAEAEDLADLAVFLASPQAKKITGQAISANGGISAA